MRQDACTCACERRAVFRMGSSHVVGRDSVASAKERSVDGAVVGLPNAPSLSLGDGSEPRTRWTVRAHVVFPTRTNASFLLLVIASFPRRRSGTSRARRRPPSHACASRRRTSSTSLSFRVCWAQEGRFLGTIVSFDWDELRVSGLPSRFHERVHVRDASSDPHIDTFRGWYRWMGRDRDGAGLAGSSSSEWHEPSRHVFDVTKLHVERRWTPESTGGTRLW